MSVNKYPSDYLNTRKFTRHELTEGITTGQYNAMSADDRDAFDRQLVRLWSDTPAWSFDLDDEPRGFNDDPGSYGGQRSGSMKSYEWGE